MKLENSYRKVEAINNWEDKHLDSRDSKLSYLITEFEGYTPNELITKVNNIAEDQVETNSTIDIFNQAISLINTDCDLNFPEIIQEQLDTPYPSFKYDYIAKEEHPYDRNFIIRTEVGGSSSFLKKVRLFRFAPTTPPNNELVGKGLIDDGSAIKIKFILKGGSIVGTPEISYLITIRATFDSSGILQINNDIGEIFAIEKIKDIDNQLSFYVVSNGEGLSLEVSPTISIGEKFNNFIVNIISIDLENADLFIGYKRYTNNSTNIVQYTYPLIVENRDPEVLVNNLYNKTLVWNLPKVWASQLFVSALHYFIYYREGEEAKLGYALSDFSKAASNFKKDKDGIVPIQLQKKIIERKQNVWKSYFR